LDANLFTDWIVVIAEQADRFNPLANPDVLR
jgi:hypothetical protein